jgi:hypothetical protein
MKASVKREDGKVWIENVPTLGWGTGRECTFAGALEAATAVTERPCKYSDLMGWSSLAFRLRWYHGDTGQRWCPSSPVGEFPDEIAALQKATGWELRPVLDGGHMDRHASEIVSSIDAGLPVLAYEPRLNVDVIYGYQDGGQTLLMRDYFRGPEPLVLPPRELGFLAIFLGEHRAGLSAHDGLIEGLKIAATNWRRGSAPAERGKYWHGDAAYAKWIDDSRDVSPLTKEERDLLFFVGHWNFCSLADARAAAAAFLKENAPLLSDEARGAVLRAAALYETEGELLGRAFRDKDAFLGMWSGKTIGDWTDAVRARERQILSEARATEADAIAEIEKALAAEGAGPG